MLKKGIFLLGPSVGILIFLLVSPIFFGKPPIPASTTGMSRAEANEFLKEEYEQREPDTTSLPIKIREAQKYAWDEYGKFWFADKQLRAKNKVISAGNMQKLKEFVSRRTEKTLLVVLDKGTGELKPILATETFLFERFRSEDKDCIINKLGGNGHAPDLLVICKGQVMPVLTLVHFHAKESPKTKGVPHIYTPYSRLIHDADVVREGKIYLRVAIIRALGAIMEKKIPSQAFPGKFIQEQYSEKLVEALLIDEHLDHQKFEEALRDYQNTETEISHIIEEVYVTDGANRERSKVFSFSNVKKPRKFQACCRAQFIPGTYKAVVKDYPEAHLAPDWLIGMRDHQNAIQAMVLLFDRDLAHFSEKARGICSRSEEHLMNCLAVSYNAGSGRLNAVIDRYGDEWDIQKPVKAGLKNLSKGLRPETDIYLKKFHMIINYLNAEK